MRLRPWARTLLAAAVVVALAVVLLTGCSPHHRVFVTGKYQAYFTGWYYVCSGKAPLQCYKYSIHRVSFNVYRQAVVGEWLEWNSDE